MNVDETVKRTAALVADRTEGRAPKVGIVLGSGLGAFADDLADPVRMSYADLPGFPEPGVAGHAGRLSIGTVGGMPVAVMQGRAHYYEQARADAMKTPVRVLRAIGCETLVLTNAAGGLDPDVGPGSVLSLTDHIGFTGVSPLFGETGNDRFVDLSDAYDPAHRARMARVADALGFELHDGVYMWFCGPHFETPAEIRAARILGANAVGMSTAPEVILARHAGMRVAALSVITNFAAGIAATALSHAETMAVAGQASGRVRALLSGFLESLANDGDAP